MATVTGIPALLFGFVTEGCGQVTSRSPSGQTPGSVQTAGSSAERPFGSTHSGYSLGSGDVNEDFNSPPLHLIGSSCTPLQVHYLET